MQTDIARTMDVMVRVSVGMGVFFEPEEVSEAYHRSIRKCELNGKDEEYFYILLEDELKNIKLRQLINAAGMMRSNRRSA